jgi:hypothetical protein
MPTSKDRGLIRDGFAEQVDPREAQHAGHVDQGILHRWTAECVPMVLRIGRASADAAGPGVMKLIQVDERLPGNNQLDLREISLTF